MTAPTNEIVYWLRERLVNAATVAGARIHPNELPQADAGPVLPAIVYQTINNKREYTKQGDANLARVTIQISCWASTYMQALQLGRQVFAALRNRHGVQYGGTGSNSFYIYGVYFVGGSDDKDADTGLYRALQEYEVQYHETI